MFWDPYPATKLASAAPTSKDTTFAPPPSKVGEKDGSRDGSTSGFVFRPQVQKIVQLVQSQPSALETDEIKVQIQDWFDFLLLKLGIAEKLIPSINANNSLKEKLDHVRNGTRLSNLLSIHQYDI